MNIHGKVDQKLEDEFVLFRDAYKDVGIDLSRERSAFLLEAQQIANIVTERQNQRHNIWTEKFKNQLVIRKGKNNMLNALASLVILFSVILGGGGATVAFAQSSLPDQPLYGIKLMSEDVRQLVTADPQAAAQLALELSNRRMEEIQTLSQTGTLPDQMLVTRYQDRLEQAIRLAANLSDEQAIQALLQTRLSLQTQQQGLAQAQLHANPNVEPTISLLQTMLQEHLRWVEEGVQQPALLRDQLQERDRMQDRIRLTSTVDPTPITTQTVPESGSLNPTNQPVPGNGFKNGAGNGTQECLDCKTEVTPQLSRTPNPVSGNGSILTGTCTPGSGNNSGPQMKNQATNAIVQPSNPEPNQNTGGTGGGGGTSGGGKNGH